MTHLILGGTGTVGGAVVRRLVKTSDKVKVLTRSAEKAQALPKGVEAVIGDLANPATFPSVFKDFDTIFIVNLVTPAELQEGLAAVNEARKAKAKRVVYLSVHLAEQGRHVPHFAAKVAIEDAVKEAGIPYTILRPNNFFQNENWFKEAILNYGVYPQPLGDKGSARVDVEDIADAAFNALTKSGFENKTYNLVGPDALTGADCARILSQGLGREIKYAGNDLDAWEKTFLQWMPHWLVYDFRLMYQMFQDQGFAGPPSHIKETEQILGHAPRNYTDYVKSLAAAWGQPSVVR